MGSWPVCADCLGPIFWGGVSVHNAIGAGFRKEGKNFHRGCLNKYPEFKGKYKKVGNNKFSLIK